MTSQARINANRRNAQRSTGPRTPEGKSVVRWNALKDGATARSPIIPGEDPAEFENRINSWKADLNPRNQVQTYLVELAARTSWQLDRLDRAHAARLASTIRNTTLQQAQDLDQHVASLGRRLFHDPRGPLQAYPHFEYRPDQPRISWSGLPDDSDHPNNLVHELESTEPGCHWLLAQWSELKRLLDEGHAWQSPDKFKAIRLLGYQPLDALDHPELAQLFVACHALDPAYNDPFHELWSELTAGEKLICQSRLSARHLPPFASDKDDEAKAARAWLKKLVIHAKSRLERLAIRHEESNAADSEDDPARLAFDDSPSGERLRRFQASCSRSLLYSLELLRKAQLPQKDPDSGPPPEKNKPNDSAQQCSNPEAPSSEELTIDPPAVRTQNAKHPRTHPAPNPTPPNLSPKMLQSSAIRPESSRNHEDPLNEHRHPRRPSPTTTHRRTERDTTSPSRGARGKSTGKRRPL